MRDQTTTTAGPPAAAIRLNVDVTRLAGVIPAVLGFHPADSLVVARWPARVAAGASGS